MVTGILRLLERLSPSRSVFLSPENEKHEQTTAHVRATHISRIARDAKPRHVPSDNGPEFIAKVISDQEARDRMVMPRASTVDSEMSSSLWSRFRLCLNMLLRYSSAAEFP